MLFPELGVRPLTVTLAGALVGGLMLIGLIHFQHRRRSGVSAPASHSPAFDRMTWRMPPLVLQSREGRVCVDLTV